MNRTHYIKFNLLVSELLTFQLGSKLIDQYAQFFVATAKAAIIFLLICAHFVGNPVKRNGFPVKRSGFCAQVSGKIIAALAVARKNCAY